MEKTLESLRQRVQQIKKKRPGYGVVLDFFVQVRESQAASAASSQVDAAKVIKAWQGRAAEEGFPLVQKDEFPIDMAASVSLFHKLCEIGKTANPGMAEQVEQIIKAFADAPVDLEKLLSGGGKEQTIEQFAADRNLDTQVLSFLVRSSTRPSIEAGREQLCGEVELKAWRQCYCPVCGSQPSLSLLKGEGGVRHSLCSYCGCQWRIDRLSCTVCGNKEQETLQYFCGEGEEVYRIDLCDKCHHYIKTIDYRGLGEADPSLEDLATMHLDVVAAQKGYTRAVPDFWGA